MKRYEEYKDTGIGWLPKLPSHWKLEQLRKYIRLVSKKGYPEKQLLSVTRELGVIIRDTESKEENHNFIPEDLSGYKYVREGQFVINKMKSWQGSYGVSAYEGIVSPAYYVCDLDFPNKDFFGWAIRSRNYVSFFAQYSKGIRVGQWDLSPVALKSIPFFEPPLAEQEKIVRFLESKTLCIDAYVAERERELQLLNELKESEIANIITRGLNPDVKMKSYNSLIASAYPEHWELKRNKSFMSLTGYKVGNNANQYTLLSLTTKGVIVRDIESGKGKFPKEFDDYQVVKKDELVFCLFDIDETPRTVGLVNTEGMITGAYTALKVNREYAIPEYIYYYYLCVDNIKALKPYYSGLRKTVRADKFLQLYMPLPPIDEQCAIVSYIEDKCNKINSLITELEGEIEYLKEYKQKLIADCVTGQINVQSEI